MEIVNGDTTALSSRWERFKAHLERNKKVYIWSAIGITAGIAGGYAIAKAEERDGGHEVRMYVDTGGGDIDTVVFGDNSTESTVNNYYGHSTKIVKCLETGEIWETVGEAARAAGVSQPVMSKHLNGHTDHVYNNHYEIIGQGTTG